MRQHNATTVFGLAASLLAVMLVTGPMRPAAGAAHQPAGRASAGQVVSAPGAELRGQSMTIRVRSGPSAAAGFSGSSSCLPCHRNKEHWQQTAHKLGWTVPGAPGRMQDFSRHPDYFDALESFPAVDDYAGGTRLELGDYD